MSLKKYISTSGTALAMGIALILLCASCKKLVEVEAPITSTSETNVFSSDATATAVMNAVYTKMSNAYFPDGGIPSISLFAGLSADDFMLISTLSRQDYLEYYRNALTSSTPGPEYWRNLYETIFTANAAVTGITDAQTLSAPVKQQLLGEAKFVRAFAYFYLVNLYGDVPLVLGTDYSKTAALPRSPQAEVWQQIIADLKDAKALLNENYPDITLRSETTERVRPTKWAASALLARSYLYTGDWPAAEAEAGAIIDHTSQFSLAGLSDVFLANNTEAIWQLQPVVPDQNTYQARLFVLSETGPDDGRPVYLSESLISAFEPGDDRQSLWTGRVTVDTTTYYFPYKYKVVDAGVPVTEYETIFRLAEQYLIRAEARIEQNNIAGGIADLNILRTRARGAVTVSVPDPLPDLSAALSKDAALAAVMQERRVELFSEWGHRWLDLKRTSEVNQVMTIATEQKGGEWQSFQQLYPIPFSETQTGIHITQNEGYQ